MNAMTYSDLAAEVEIPADGTSNKTLFQDEHVKVVVFGFAAGHGLKEHTARVPVMIQLIDGEADVAFGKEQMTANRNAFLHLPANLPHSISAITATRMLLIVLKNAK